MSYATFVSNKLTYAIIGVSLDVKKFGNRVFSYMKENKYNVFPINPKGGVILDSKIYKSIDEIDKKIDVIVFVVSPKIATAVLEKVIQKGIKKAWFQPGSESLEAKRICEKNDIEFVMEECIMIESEKMKL